MSASIFCGRQTDREAVVQLVCIQVSAGVINLLILSAIYTQWHYRMSQHNVHGSRGNLCHL